MATDQESSVMLGPRPNSGIPQAVFVEDVDDFMSQTENESVDEVLRRLDEQHQKYKFLEFNLLQKKRRLKTQMPDIKTTLDIVKYMQKKKDSSDSLPAQFLLSDQVYAKATIPPSDKVCLWLGANVMLEYSLVDAETLLTKNLDNAQKTLKEAEQDLDFLRDQYTTTEVNIARVYNWNVKKNKKPDT
ncbi:prefoldin subunit 3-like [Antedon mediterranea]|uniref:prefoldin subunit 3-like n=1 Tax=Antedon mediterranea TaxID=105859 RepID=UPI003AF46B9D